MQINNRRKRKTKIKALMVYLHKITTNGFLLLTSEHYFSQLSYLVICVFGLHFFLSYTIILILILKK